MLVVTDAWTFLGVLRSGEIRGCIEDIGYAMAVFKVKMPRWYNERGEEILSNHVTRIRLDASTRVRSSWVDGANICYIIYASNPGHNLKSDLAG